MDWVTAVVFGGEWRSMNMPTRATDYLQRSVIFYAVILAEGGYPETQTPLVDWTRLRKPTFWIPGYAKNDAKLKRFRRAAACCPGDLRKVQGVVLRSTRGQQVAHATWLFLSEPSYLLFLASMMHRFEPLELGDSLLCCLEESSLVNGELLKTFSKLKRTALRV